MAAPATYAPAVDEEMVAEALRSLGLLQGAQCALARILPGARDESDAIRAYILGERPHLLKCYDLETLVGVVRAAIARGRQAPELEEFVPS